jgi:protein-glutamine gamma-glutamyltransferase
MKGRQITVYLILWLRFLWLRFLWLRFLWLRFLWLRFLWLRFDSEFEWGLGDIQVNGTMTTATPKQTWRAKWQQTSDRLRVLSDPPEESLALRLLVQGLVIVGILATEFAAADSADPIGLAPLAIPGSLIGAWWSWRQRHKRNIATKFAIAIGMLVALSFFFGDLFVQRNDTRLVLVKLLIQLQVLHSFDLPRRKDLGYSIVIGLILLGVAATLSQTLSFAPFLLLFVTIALPVMILDYSSRLGIVAAARDGRSGNFWNIAPDMGLRRLAILLGLTTLIGLGIFALLPRLPGYQLRSLPVSAPIKLQQRFDSQQILNPGYVRGGQGNGNGDPGQVQGGGRSPDRGPGKVDDEFYYGFGTRINQNLRGSMKPMLLMRVRSQLESVWRVMAFDHYTGQGWEISRNSATLTLNRSVWNYQFNIPTLSSKLPSREIVQTYTMVAKLPNVIPALTQPKEVYFPTEQIAIDTENGLRSPVPLDDGTTYSVISEVNYRDRTLLNQASTNYPPGVRRAYLQVSPAEAPRWRQQAEALLATSPKPLTTVYEKALYLTQTLKQRYDLRSDLPFFAENEDLVSAFLFNHKGGYPDHFSTTLTMLLRSIGIPARFAVGFAPGEFNPFTGFYQVYNTDAYGLSEVYFPDMGWFAFDPIPGHPLFPPALEENETFGTLKKIWQWVAGWLPSPLRNQLNAWFGALFGFLMGLLNLILGIFSGDLVSAMLGIALLVFLGFLGWLLIQGWSQWRYRQRLARLAPMEQRYRQTLDRLSAQGWSRSQAQTPFEYAQSIRSKNPELSEPIDRISQVYVNWRYGNQEPDLGEVDRLLAQLNQQLQATKKPALPGWKRRFETRQ